MTCSPSFLRIRPWSTNTHVSWSPTARCTSSAATEESTPPERPQITRPLADLGADPLDLLLDDRGRAPRARAAADLLEERRQHVLAVGRVDDLGVELDAVEAALDVLQRGDRRLRRARQRAEAGRRLEDRVAVRHPAALLRRRAGEQPPGLGHRQLRAPELPHLGALDAAAEREHQRLHAVTDAEHRDAELEQLRIEPRRAVGVDRGGPAGEDQPLRPAPRAPPRRRRGAAAARRTRRTRARGARSAASTARRSRGRRPRRSRPRARARAPPGAGPPRRRTRAPRTGAQSATSATPFDRAPMPICWSRWSCLPSVCSDGAIISSARLNSAMSW